MRVFLIILLVLLLIIALLCMLSVSLSLEWWDSKLKWNVRVCGIKILPRKKKKRKLEKKDTIKKTKKASAESEKSAETAEKAPKKQEETDRPKEFFMDKLWRILQKIAKYGDLAGSAFFAIPKPLRKIGKAFTLSHVRTDIVIADEDAGKCAHLYGQVQLLTQQFLANAGKAIHVRRKKVSIVCDFTADESKWNVGFRLRFRLGPALAAAVMFLFYFLRDVRRAKKAVISEKI